MISDSEEPKVTPGPIREHFAKASKPQGCSNDVWAHSSDTIPGGAEGEPDQLVEGMQGPACRYRRAGHNLGHERKQLCHVRLRGQQCGGTALILVATVSGTALHVTLLAPRNRSHPQHSTQSSSHFFDSFLSLTLSGRVESLLRNRWVQPDTLEGKLHIDSPWPAFLTENVREQCY